jgi:DNA-binding response OmpR family regulator
VVGETSSGFREPEESPGLEGEDLGTSHWEDARHWIGIYADLLRFKVRLLDRVRRDLPTLHPAAEEAASADLAIIESQMHGYQVRLDLWYRRLWEMQGLQLDPEGPMIRHRGMEARLTKREFQLLQFLLDHPHRSFTATQLLARAWADPTLYPEEVRNYVRRLRKLLADLKIPCELVNRSGQGYSLVFREDE